MFWPEDVPVRQVAVDSTETDKRRADAFLSKVRNSARSELSVMDLSNTPTSSSCYSISTINKITFDLGFTTKVIFVVKIHLYP
jgi:hypothetical protein